MPFLKLPLKLIRVIATRQRNIYVPIGKTSFHDTLRDVVIIHRFWCKSGNRLYTTILIDIQQIFIYLDGQLKHKRKTCSAYLFTFRYCPTF